MDFSSAFGGRWAWLAPVMGCFLVFLVVSGTHNERMTYWSSAHRTDWPATVAGNQGYASYIMVGFHSEQNSLQKDPIEWTNAARLPSEPRLNPTPTTNNSEPLINER